MKLKAYSVSAVLLLLVATACQNKGSLLKAEKYGDEWPLIVSECYVKCVGDYAVVVSVDDHTYAVNKAAMQMNQFEDIRPIVKDNPLYPKGQEKMSLSKIEFEGLKNCEPKE